MKPSENYDRVIVRDPKPRCCAVFWMEKIGVLHGVYEENDDRPWAFEQTLRFQNQDQNKSATWRKSCLVWESLTCNQYHKGHAKHHLWCCGMQKIGHAVVPRNQAKNVNPSFCSMMGTHEDTAENHIFHVMSQPWLTIFSASHRWLCPLDQFLQLVPLILRESRLNEKRKSGVWFSYIRIIQSQSDIFKKKYR